MKTKEQIHEIEWLTIIPDGSSWVDGIVSISPDRSIMADFVLWVYCLDLGGQDMALITAAPLPTVTDEGYSQSGYSSAAVDPGDGQVKILYGMGLAADLSAFTPRGEASIPFVGKSLQYSVTLSGAAVGGAFVKFKMLYRERN